MQNSLRYFAMKSLRNEDSVKSKYYRIKLKTLGPIFIGSGEKLNKKEYIYNPSKKTVIIPDFVKMYEDIKKNNHEKDFQKFIMGYNKDLYKWLCDYGYNESIYSKWTRYTLDCGDAILEKGKTSEVLSFVKDPYNIPYIPGSSLKGMLRTILLSNDILNNRLYDSYASKLKNDSKYPKGNYYLSNNIREIETECYNILDKNSKVKENAVNDIMSGVIISDSKPLKVDDLVLCQKCDKHTDGNVRNLPILRECIKPGVTIEFNMEIREETGITKDIITDAVKNFSELYYKNVISKYDRNIKTSSDMVWLGGGVGFHSKTVINALFKNYEDGFNVTDNIMKNTLNRNYFKHKHNHDYREMVSPHILKVTKYKGIMYQMGCSKMEIVDL